MASAQQTPNPPAVNPGGGGWLQFLKDVWAELHRVTWPSQETVIKHTTIVVSLVIFMALYIGFLDWALTLGFHKLFH